MVTSKEKKQKEEAAEGNKTAGEPLQLTKSTNGE
jgi:hypothetical protein